MSAFSDKSILINGLLLGSGWAIVQALTSQSICLMLGAGVSVAQQSPQMLPPPPPIQPVPDLEMKPVPSASPSFQRESVFQAPVDPNGATAGRYLVYVNGDSPYLLQQVRTVEPTAFIQQYQGRRVIQTGTFNSASNAQQQIASLNARGVMAEMSAISLPPTLTKTSRYWVIVPGTRNDLPSLKNQAVRLGVRQEVIQEKDAPLGPHLEIGPFAERGEAKDVDRFLRGSGLDSRVYYSR